MRLLAAALFALAPTLPAQPGCPPTPTYSPCDIVLELPDSDAAAHPNPYLSVELHAEFRSPRHRTLSMPGFWDGGRRFLIRFSPTDPGPWDFRITSNVKALSGHAGQFTATDSGSPGFLRPDNVHHFSHTEIRRPHLWMGDTSYRFAWIDRALFDTIIEKRAAQNFNHIRGLVMHNDDRLRKAFTDPDHPNHEHFRELDQRILAMNRKGIFADLVLASDQNHLAELMPQWQQRERFIRYLVARYSAMMITWQGVQEFEEYKDGRALLKEIGLLLKKLDPYQHPRSTHTVRTSAPLLADGWMNYVTYQSSDNALGAIERQLLMAPLVNSEFAYEDSGAGRSHPHHTDSDTFRRRLWNATMNGQYPTFGNTGTYGGRNFEVDAKFLDSPGARAMTAWHEFFSRTRFWELEPYFEVDGGRALALTGIEYIVYLEKPGPIELVTEKKGYEVYWFRPSTGEIIKEKKDYKGERFSGSPPDTSSDWVLHLSRDGRKEGMLKSWKFESRPVFRQEVERNPQRVPFEIVEPSSEVLTAGQPCAFAVKLKRETRATSSMLYLWTAEATADGQGYRVIATGDKGQFTIPASLARNFPAVVNLRLLGMNLNGKVYSLDRVMRLSAK
jgi:hypothetical protein